MGDPNTTNGRRWSPLVAEQLERFGAPAEESEDDLTRLTALMLSNTGLRNVEFCSLRRKVLEEELDGITPVRNPHQGECMASREEVSRSAVAKAGSVIEIGFNRVRVRLGALRHV